MACWQAGGGPPLSEVALDSAGRRVHQVVYLGVCQLPPALALVPHVVDRQAQQVGLLAHCGGHEGGRRRGQAEEG